MKCAAEFILLVTMTSISSFCFADGDRIFKENHKAVVTIFSYGRYGIRLGQGSGFFITSDGALVTNHHVIDSAKVIKVKIGKRLIKARPIYVNKKSDVVILKINSESIKIPSLRLGDTSRIAIGDKVYVIGTPLGLEHTFSDGIVSAIRRLDDDKQKYIQFTAPVSPGSSGGPVFNKDGEVIGIATMIIENNSFGATAQSLNMAIPIDVIKHKIDSKGRFGNDAKVMINRLFNHKGMMYFFIGVILFFVSFRLNLLKKWFNFLHTLQHELIHLGVAGLFGGSPLSLEVNTTGGSANTTKNNFIVRLSPYVLPLFSFMVLGISFLFDPRYKSIAIILAGIFYGNFIWRTISSWQIQSDILKSRWKGFVYFFIVVANMGILALIGLVSKTV